MTLTRRAFLRDTGSAALGLTVAFRFNLGASATEAPTPEFAPNAFIRIGSDNVVRLWAIRSEMGQGVRTLLPMVLADELEADWEKVVIEQAEMGARFKGVRLRTSGSGSAAGTWAPLRKAAATAREMLIRAAADQWQVDPQTCSAQQSTVIHAPTGRRLTYGQLATAASKVPVPTKPRLKETKDFRLVGKPVKRRDSQAIVNGSAVYGLDVKLPGMLHAAVARCPYLGGKLVSCDPAPAMKISGVKNVIPVRSGFSGGVAVIAVNTWAALKGRDALQPVWDKGPNAGFDSDSFMRELEHSLPQPGFPIRRTGDAPTGLAGSPTKLEAIYEYPYQAHAPLETMNCTADVRGALCEIWVPTQAPEAAQQETAKLLGIAADAVKVNVTMLGGGFGRRLQVDYVLEAVEISKAAGKPVQVFWTRGDDMKHGFFQAPKIEHIQAGLDADSKPMAWLHKSCGPDLSVLGLPTEQDRKNPNFYSDDGMPWGLFDNPYNFTHHSGDFVPVQSPVPTGPWRAVMYPSTVFARESFLDEIAHASKIDPIELRLRLLAPGDVLDLKSQKIDRARLIAVLRLAAEKSGWPTPPREEHGRLWGRGIACNVYSEDCYIAQVAEVSLSKDLSDIKVHRMISAIDCGFALNPLGIEGQTESAIAWGLSATLGGKIHFKNGQAQERSYADFKVLRMDQAPHVETYLLQGSEMPGGFGETAVPPVAPAIANAIFAATGKRMRRLPITVEKLKNS
ncbi:MAG TPA: xanthine dehydrogenase family protein molybdopterin-binding subunit [Candidatus Angelobacter sp.]